MMRLLRPAVITAACVIAAACSSLPVLPMPGSDSAPLVSQGCEHFSRHQYEVCYAYLVGVRQFCR
jgi:hypothetical protein